VWRQPEGDHRGTGRGTRTGAVTSLGTAITLLARRGRREWPRLRRRNPLTQTTRSHRRAPCGCRYRFREALPTLDRSPRSRMVLDTEWQWAQRRIRSAHRTNTCHWAVHCPAVVAAASMAIKPAMTRGANSQCSQRPDPSSPRPLAQRTNSRLVESRQARGCGEGTVGRRGRTRTRVVIRGSSRVLVVIYGSLVPSPDALSGDGTWGGRESASRLQGCAGADGRTVNRPPPLAL